MRYMIRGIIISLTSILYADTYHDVRQVGNTGVVGEMEASYVRQREAGMPHIVNEKTPQPRIAICCSGGGIRAVLATTGLLDGLDRTGLLDAVSYMAALSGSTWAFIPWLLTEYTPEELRNYMVTQTEQFSPEQFLYKLKTVIPYLLKQYFYYHRPSIIDVYGAFLADTLLRDITHKPPLQLNTRDLRPCEDIHPFMLNSFIVPTNKEFQYVWAEMTPFEIGSHGLGYYVPLELFGSTFKAGKVTSTKPATKLAYDMGWLGSAMSVSMKEAIDMFFKSPEKRSPRLLPAKMPNFTRDLPHAPFAKKRNITCIDAGISCNIPIMPLVAAGRYVDVIIICDTSGGLPETQELAKAEQLARNYGKPIAEIDYKRAGKEVCSIFESDAPYIPTIIYIPTIYNPDYDLDFNPINHMDWGDYLNTFNFSYTREQAQRFAGLVEFNVKQYKDHILSAIERKAQRMAYQ